MVMLLPPEWTSHAGQWLRAQGPASDVVVSTRIRLARNVEGFPFPWRVSPETRVELEERLQVWISRAEIAQNTHYCNLHGMNSLDMQVLMERHLISRELVNAKGDRGVTFTSSELLSLMTNEEDHLRIQVIRSGLDLNNALAAAQTVDRRLEVQIPYAFSPDYGFLTSCPTNVGTGLRVSVMMHLPALVISNQMDKVFQAAARVGLTVRGFYGEGSKAAGDVIQISNQQTLGRSEEEILDSMGKVAPKIVEYERGVRQHLLTHDRGLLDDKVWRSVGILRYARRISSAEAMDLLSAVRLGVNLRLIPHISLPEINELFVITQPGHLQANQGSELKQRDRDAARASFLRQRLKPEVP